MNFIFGLKNFKSNAFYKINILELKRLEKTNNKPFSFPWFFIIFGYILCGICIANGVWWPYLYSIQWGKDLSLEWMSTFVLSILLSVLVTQPCQVFNAVLRLFYSFKLQLSKYREVIGICFYIVINISMNSCSFHLQLEIFVIKAIIW